MVVSLALDASPRAEYYQPMYRPELRRQFLRFGAVAAASLVWEPSVGAAECAETEDNIEGPFYKPGAPERASLWEPGMEGTKLVVSGRILDTHCRPISYATLDAWQCSANGVYDNDGYTLRGKQKTDGKGRYELTTILPPPYKVSQDRYRPAHIHLKLHASGAKLLTTQLYFDGDRWNAVDTAYRKSLTLRPADGRNGSKKASFDFHLRLEA
jgi:protocatechuate 3,4-dioxygenase beta subunit